jgi:uncharacterized protein
MVTGTYILDELGEVDCRRLLEVAPMGRIGFTQGALPRIRPVNFTVRGDEIVMGGLSSYNAVATDCKSIVVFEADSYNTLTGEGWSVSVIGPVRLVTDPVEISELDALGFAPVGVERRCHYFAIPVDGIQGRRLCREAKLTA